MSEYNFNDTIANKGALYQKLDQDDLICLDKIFKSAKEQKFTINELEHILKEFHITFSPDRIKSLFLKVKYFCFSGFFFLLFDFIENFFLD